MKLRITLVLMFVLGSFCFAQTSGFSSAEFNSSMFLNEKLAEFKFTKIEKPFAFDFQRDDSNFTMLEIDNNSEINSEVLNTSLFSNLKLFENNYQNDYNYSRGCGPLDGLTHTINSSDIMISRFVDYAVNEFLKSLIFND
ncbi:hypothetical protein [Winogradskyella pacifica]|uniref:GLPGLI family protein n=1 Tax=Winogradskyella pacifica TaxID=664642 RepID=A0A3D9N4U2_9FLAO|nr:hypothetical protein [Winogradskyella pacifica]REE27798.1 hypothetical protein DFQ09_101637 [Winogradskyella pacifica]